LLSSLWPFFGSLITLVWFELTPPGGTFMIFWGPIAFGYVAFIQNLVSYFKNAQPVTSTKKN